MPERVFENGWVEEWQGNKGILKNKATDSWFFVRAYNMEPDGRDEPVRPGEEAAFQWIHEGARMIVTRCIRCNHTPLPREWVPKPKWPPKVGKWTPVAKLGQGGHGEVWRAHCEDSPDIAIKYLRACLNNP